MHCRFGFISGMMLVVSCWQLGAVTCFAYPATRPVMPDTTPAGKPHFDLMGAQVGEQLPALPVYALDGEQVSLDKTWGAHATLLITSSYTCPKSRSTYANAALLAHALKGKVSLAFIYVIEAHPSGDPSPYSGVEEVTNENRLDHVLCAQPRTLKDRLALARRFQKRLGVAEPIYVDAMDNAAWKSLGGGPNMGMLVDDSGIVLARQGWFDADSMKNAVDAFLAAMPLHHKRLNEAKGFADFNETQPTVDGNLEQVKAQISKSPRLVTQVFPYMPRGSSGDMTLLHYAVGTEYPRSQHLDVVQFLIEKGADINKQTEHTPSALHLAAKNGNLPIAKFLIEHGADVNAKAQGHGPTPLQEALIYNHAEIVKLLVQSGAKPNFFSDVSCGNVEAVRAKLEADPSIVHRPDGWRRPPIAYAAAAGEAEMVKLLLAGGARDLPHSAYYFRREESAIWWAVHTKNVLMIRLLCENGSDPNLLEQAIYDDSADVARELLAHKADPNREDMSGLRPLHNAAVFDRAEIAEMLINAGADPNAFTGVDRSPCGPPDSDARTALHLAAIEGSAKTISELIKHGAKLNALNSSGQTPLHLSVSSYEPTAKVLDAVKVLIEAKADINAKDADGLTPLDCAIKANRTADKSDSIVINLLKEHGAKIGSLVPGPNAVPTPMRSGFFATQEVQEPDKKPDSPETK